MNSWRCDSSWVLNYINKESTHIKKVLRHLGSKISWTLALNLYIASITQSHKLFIESRILQKDVNNHAWSVPKRRSGKTADQFQSYHQEGGTFLVLSVVLPFLKGKFRCLLVSALLRCVRKGSHEGNFPDVTEWTKAMLFGHGEVQRCRNCRRYASLRPPKGYYCSWWPLFTDFSWEEPRKQRHHGE